jgi:hypothetical protein
MLRLLALVLVLAGYVVMDALNAVRIWLAVRPIRRIRAWRNRKKMQSWLAEHGPADEVLEDFNSTDEVVSMNPFPKGTQTLSGIAVLVLVPWLAKLGIDSAQVEAIVAAAGTLIGAGIAVLGYLRRKKLPAE